MAGHLYIGTSGWMYKDWGEAFYPKDLKKGHLSFLAQEFSTVEVNSSFYHLPLASTFKKWRDEVPDTFVFAVKLSRYITHQKKLRSVRAPLLRFMMRAKRMLPKIGVILVQLPPSFTFDEKTLRKFVTDIEATKKRSGLSVRFALEPRHRSWLECSDAAKAELRESNIALVFPHSATIPSFAPIDENVTADFVYVRFHGPSEFAASRYGAKRLRPWAERIAAWHAKNIDVFVYFNNDVHGHAIIDARTLTRQVARLTRH